MASTSTLFLFLSDHFVSAYLWKKGVCDEGDRFENSEEGQVDFADYLEGLFFDGPIYLLVDVTEEDLHNEVIPKLLGANKKKMLASRSGRIFRHTPFHMGYSQGKVSGEKNKEQALFVGLAEPDRVLSWLNILKKRRARIAGIVSLPVLCQQVFKKIAPASKDVLFITPNSGGLRQIFLRDGQMLVSRLSPIHAQEAEGVQLFIHGEVSKMQGYLASLRLVNHHAVLDVLIVCRGSLYALLESGRDKISLYTSHPVDVDALARRLGGKMEVRAKPPKPPNLPDGSVEPADVVERLSATENVEPFFCYFLIKQRIWNHYARLEDTRIHRSFRARFWLRVASFALFFLGMSVSGVAFWDSFDMSAKLPRLSRLADDAQVALQSVALQGSGGAKQGVSLPSDGGAALVVAVRTMDTLLQYAVDPQSFLMTVSQILTHHANIQVDNIKWFAGMPASKNPVRGRRPRVRPMTKPGVQNARLQGKISPFSGNYLAAQEKISLWVNDLRALPEVLEVTVLSMPEDPRQTAVLDGGNASLLLQEANFVLQVTLKIDKEKHGKH